MRLEVLVDATNQLLRVERPSSENLRAMLVIGCKELRMVLSDPTFFSDLRAVQTSPLLDDAELRATFSALARFSAFLAAEQTVMREAGLDAAGLSALSQQTTALRPLLAQRQNVDADALRLGLIKLANEVCNLADLAAPGEAQEFRRTARPVLRRVALAVSGATVITANIAATVKLGQVYATASISVGAAMMKEGVFGD